MRRWVNGVFGAQPRDWVPIWPFQVFPLVSNAPNTILVRSINPHIPEV